MEKRKKRVRSKVLLSKERPRLSVFRSNEHIYAQIVDDKKSTTMVSAGDMEVKEGKKKKNTKNSKKTNSSEKVSKKLDIAFKVGELIAKKAIKKKIKSVVFDRGGYKYHGRVAALAEGARKGGLKF